MTPTMITDIDELHDRLYDVLCTVDDICTKNNIRYFLDSGTEIGAVREHDFIAWDDDMDLKVLLEDYDAFKAVMKKELPPYMQFEEPSDRTYWVNNVVRINDTRFIIDENDFNSGSPVFVGTDVFIFCPVPDNSVERKRILLKTKILYVLGMGHRYHVDWNKYNKLGKCIVFLIGRIGKLFSIKWLWQKNLWIYDKYKGKNDSYFAFSYRIENIDKRFYEADIFKETEYLTLRDRKFPVPAEYDRELTISYGDYMTPEKDASIYIQHLHDTID